MSEGYVLAGYGATVVTLALYAVRVVRRGRSLSRAVAATPAAPAPDEGR